MRRMMFCLFIVGAITLLSSPAANAQMQIYGAWHCATMPVPGLRCGI